MLNNVKVTDPYTHLYTLVLRKNFYEKLKKIWPHFSGMTLQPPKPDEVSTPTGTCRLLLYRYELTTYDESTVIILRSAGELPPNLPRSDHSQSSIVLFSRFD